MAKPLVSDELWDRIEPLLPPQPPRRFRYPGRKPIPPRQLLCGILFVLKTGIRWDDLPAELGWGCGRTCRQTFAAWHRAGVWRRLHESLLADLHAAGLLDWSRALLDSASVRAPRGGEGTGPSPVDRRKSGTKHHVITEAGGAPLTATTTGANRHDSTQLRPLVRAIPPVRGRRGRPRRRPKAVQGDRAYDSGPHRAWPWLRGITPRLARRKTAHGSGLGKTRWFVERTLSWLHGFGRLRRRLDRTLEIHEGFVSLACALICLRLLQGTG
jgi:transposase